MLPDDESEMPDPRPIGATTPDDAGDADTARAQLGDRIGAFTTYTVAADFLTLREIYSGNFARMHEEDWARRSERRVVGWTRLQALAHVEAMTLLYNQVIRDTIAGRTASITGLSSRTQLKAFNQATIEARTHIPVEELVTSFLDALSHAAELVAPLTVETMLRRVPLPHFSSPPTVAELFGSSLAHAGIVHATQLAVSRARPIWIYFQPSLMRRQITRFIHLRGLNYWLSRAGQLHATIAIQIAGQGGGSWIIRLSPEGAQGRIGRARTNDVTFSFPSADLFCRMMCYQTSPWREWFFHRLHVSGNLNLARRTLTLFKP